jgi:hypothetical protein
MQQKCVAMHGYTFHAKVLSFYKYISKNECTRCTSAEGQKKELKAMLVGSLY